MIQFLDPRLPDRFWDKCIPEPMSGCWLWLGAINSNGYGNIYWRRRQLGAHRLAWIILVGEPTPGLELDHLCRNRACCNPDHLEEVTTQVNLLRGIGRTSINANATECPHGHPYSPENTRYQANGSRLCRACVNTRKLVAYHGARDIIVSQ